MPIRFVIFLAFLGLLSACAHQRTLTARPYIDAGTRAELAILESTDIHSNILSYDYYKLAEDPNLGFERLATLIKQARAEFPNTVLLDDGDTIQGNALSDYQALISPLRCNEELAVYRVMDALKYDAGTIGNHEFNYGLAFLSQVTGTAFHIDGVPQLNCNGPHFPLVLSNVFSARDHQPIFSPYRIITKTIATTAPDGTQRQVPIRIGLMGFTPPPIMNWDRTRLSGKVYTRGLVETAAEIVPKLKAQGVDVIIVLSHGGIDASTYSELMENGNWHLAKVPGIDVLLLGHSHDIFPNPKNPQSRFNHIPEVDNVRGTVQGVPAVMGDFWGKSLGLVQLALRYDNGHWQVDRQNSHSEVRSIKQADGSFVEPDRTVAPLVGAEHMATIAYVKTPVGTSDFEINSYFALVGDNAVTQLINSAQRDYVEKYININLPQFVNLPILSTASAFKTGFGGAHDYTDIPAGALTIGNAADLYPYPNTLAAVKINGAELYAWLENAAKVFMQIDPTSGEPQALIDKRVPAYNFDVLQGEVHYLIDVSQPLGSRIHDLRYRNQPVTPEQDFIVVTNSYRANGGGNFPGLDGSKTILIAPDGNRDALIEFLRKHTRVTREDNANDRSWRFVKVHTRAPITFVSAMGKLDLAHAASLHNVAFLNDNGDGTTTYTIDLEH